MKKLWYFYQLQDPIKTKLFKRYEHGSESKTEKDIVLEEILKIYPARLESMLNTYQRRESFKRFLSDYQKASLKMQGQICIVGHS